MKFTIALTFFAAASALELKEDGSEIIAAIDSLTADMSEEGLECALGEIIKMLDNMTWDEAMEIAGEVEEGLEDDQVTLKHVMDEIFNSQELEDVYGQIKSACFAGM